MIEVVFSESAGGVLRYAQGWGEGKYCPSAVGFALPKSGRPSKIKQWCIKKQYERREKKAWEDAVVLSGSGRDVYALSLGLSMGKIAPGDFWNDRVALFAETRRFDGCADDAEKAAERQIEKVQSNLEQITERAAKGESIRIWVGTSGEECCMLAWFAAQIEEYARTPQKVYLNQLPEKYDRPQGGSILWNDWAEVEPGMWGILDRDFRREVSAEFFREQAAVWRSLQGEDTALRIVENGILKSVSEDYYDALIWQEIDRQPDEFHEAHLIGSLLGGRQLRMPDTWIAARIEKMIASGRLQIAWEENPGSHSYRRRLKKG